MLLTRAMEDYTYYCKGKDLSLQTLRWYGLELRLFAKWLRGEQGITKLDDIRRRR